MLRIEGLRRRAGEFRLRVDHWTVEPGRYLVLVGPSGAGKTMLLETVAGLHGLQAGHVWIAGREVTHWPPEARGVGFVYQDCWLFPLLTVRRNIEFGRRYRRNKAGAAGPGTDELAEMLNIRGLLDRRPGTLSSGERQRVALARALAVAPRLLFLDEPLGTLDPVMREHVAAELQRCHRSFGTTTIHVTHDHDEARMIGDTAAVMLHGALEQSGATDEVFRRPRTIELARFLGCENLFETVVTDGDTAEMAKAQLGHGSLAVRTTIRGRATLCVRSEDVYIEPGSDGPCAGGASSAGHGLTRLSGSIVELSDRGATARLVIDVDGRRWVSLVGHPQQARWRFRAGDRVRVCLPADAGHVIPLEEQSCR